MRKVRCNVEVFATYGGSRFAVIPQKLQVDYNFKRKSRSYIFFNVKKSGASPNHRGACQVISPLGDNARRGFLNLVVRVKTAELRTSN